MSRGATGALVATLLAVLAFAAVPTAGNETATPILAPAMTPLQERQFVQGVLEIWQGRLDDAADHMGDLVRRQPDFRLAQLVYGDLLSAMGGRLSRFGHGAGNGSVVDYRDEARARMARYLASPPTTGNPADILRLPESAPGAVLVDLTSYRLYQLANRDGRPVAERDYYVSIGKGGGSKVREGDEKTPLGVYYFTTYLPGRELPDLYGVGALPIDYPNGWDRLRGRTGSGIWLHGTESDRYSRPPLSSRGCVTLPNEDFRVLRRGVEIGSTPVLVTDRLEWSDGAEIDARRRELESAVESWRGDWESRDTGRYLSHYAADFRTQGMSRAAFAAHKARVNAGKRFIRVGVEDLGIYRYPGEADLVVVHFVQRYESDTFRSTRRKHQYWRRGGDGWRIVFEETV